MLIKTYNIIGFTLVVVIDDQCNSPQLALLLRSNLTSHLLAFSLSSHSPNSPHPTPNSLLSTLYSNSPLPTPHSPLPTPHSELPTPHTPLRTPHTPLPTPNSLLSTLYSNTPLPTPHFPFLTPHTPLPTPHFPFLTPHTPLPTPHSHQLPVTVNTLMRARRWRRTARRVCSATSAKLRRVAK